MNKAALLARYDRLRSTIELYGMRREVTPYGVRHLDPNGAGMILYTDLDDTNVEVAIHAHVAHFASIGQPFEWVVYQHEKPADLITRLTVHGFDIDDPEAIMVLDITHALPSLLQPVAHDVRRITSPDKIDDIIIIREQVFQRNFSATAKTLRTRLADNDDLALYVAYVENRPVSTAQISFYPQADFAGLGGAATLPNYRGQGLYTALLAARVQAAKRRDVPYLDADASPMSQPILEKFGFEWLTEARVCEWNGQ